MPGFNMAQAIGMFIIGLGLVEKDGLLVCAGVIIGLLGVVLLGRSCSDSEHCLGSNAIPGTLTAKKINIVASQGPA